MNRIKIIKYLLLGALSGLLGACSLGGFGDVPNIPNKSNCPNEILGHLIYQIEMERNFHMELVNINKNLKDRRAALLVHDHDTALLSLFEIIIKCDRKSRMDLNSWRKVRDILVNYMNETGGPGSSEGWVGVQDYFSMDRD